MNEERKWSLSISVRGDILEIVASGEVTPDTAHALEKEVFDAVKTKGMRNVLVDVRGLQGRFSVVDAYERVRSHHRNAPATRTAVIDVDEHKDLQQFYEDASFNVGRNRRWFTDADKAWAWLHSNQAQTRT